MKGTVKMPAKNACLFSVYVLCCRRHVVRLASKGGLEPPFLFTGMIDEQL